MGRGPRAGSAEEELEEVAMIEFGAVGERKASKDTVSLGVEFLNGFGRLGSS